jgi:elongation factor Ts
MITAATVKELRDKTNAGMMDCKRALEETNGDLDAAITLLREKGIAKAAKKADRAANEGTITARISADGKTGILLEINCETDFVSKNENFQGFVAGIADTLIVSKAADLAAANAADNQGLSVEDTIKAKITEIGENLLFRKYVRFEAQGEGAIAFKENFDPAVGHHTLCVCGATEEQRMELDRAACELLALAADECLGALPTTAEEDAILLAQTAVDVEEHVGAVEALIVKHAKGTNTSATEPQEGRIAAASAAPEEAARRFETAVRYRRMAKLLVAGFAEQCRNVYL